MPIVTFYHDGLWWAEYDGNLGVHTTSSDTAAKAIGKFLKEEDNYEERRRDNLTKDPKRAGH